MDKWLMEEPEVKAYISALSDARNLMRKEHARLLAEQNIKAVAAAKRAAARAKEEAAPGIPLGFNPIRCNVILRAMFHRYSVRHTVSSQV